MEIKKFEEVLEKCKDNIIEVGIKKGYFRLEDKHALEEKLKAIIDRGIDLELSGDAVYGYYSPKDKKLHYNPSVYKNEQEAMIYVLHEMKHGLDHYPPKIGFQFINSRVGINEGATHRFATEMTEEILGIKIPEKEQKSAGIYLTTKLDEYQIEDRLNSLFCRAIGISMEEFIKAQNEPEFITLSEYMRKFGVEDFKKFQAVIDMVYRIRQSTFADKNGQPLEKEKKLDENEINALKKYINIGKKLITDYVLKTNPEMLESIKVEMDDLDREVKEIDQTSFAQVAETSIGEKDKVQKVMKSLAQNRDENTNNYGTNGEGDEQADDN